MIKEAIMRSLTPIPAVTVLALVLVACGQSTATDPATGAAPSTLPPALVPEPAPEPLDAIPPTIAPPSPPAAPTRAENVHRPVTPIGAVCWALTESTLVLVRQTVRAVADDPTLVVEEAAGAQVDLGNFVDVPEKSPIDSLDEAIAYLDAPGTSQAPDGVGPFSKRLHDALVAMRADVATLDADDQDGFAAALEAHLGDLESWPGYQGLATAAEKSPHCAGLDDE